MLLILKSVQDGGILLDLERIPLQVMHLETQKERIHVSVINVELRINRSFLIDAHDDHFESTV